ncbi:MAG TPA: hypothetical protein VIR63_00280, partial [Pontiella sp.]
MGLSRKSKRLLRIIAPAAFFVFLILLQFHLSRRDPRRVCVDAISPFHNFSRVRVEGVLESGARRLRGGSVLYMVNDGSGTIAVFDEQAVGVEAVKGTRISAEGYLNVGANNDVRLRAKSVELHEWNLPPAPAGCELVNITAKQKG